MNIRKQLMEQAADARAASKKMALISTVVKNAALNAMADALISQQDNILAENEKDMASGREKGLSQALLDRLMVNEERIKDMAAGLHQVAVLNDPIGEGTKVWTGADGIQITQVRTPIGVIGIIYEARPNVTVDASALCLKSGNAVILKGGSEAIHTNAVIADTILEAAIKAGLPAGCIQLIASTDREAVNLMMKMNGLIDVLIPRGGAGLIKTVVENASVPVIETGVGNCHVYLDREADVTMAEKIIINSKTHRTGVCNAAETLLVHQEFAQAHLQYIGRKLIEKGVELHGCDKTRALIPESVPASDTDWETEYLDMILAVKVVDSVEDAIAHIEKYGTKHSEAIVTENYSNALRFQQEVDAAAVYVNASTRYTDGFQFGFGAEIGISTQKLHARGPMGLEALTSTKYTVMGTGQVRR